MKEQPDTYSIREKNLWFEFLVNLAVGIYYWPQALRLMTMGDDALRGSAMIGLIASTVVVAVAVSIALSIFLHAQQKPEPMDERDFTIEARASVLASRVLVTCVFVIIGHLVMQELATRLDGEPVSVVPFTSYSLTLSPLVLAHALLIAVMLWSFVGTVTRLYFYRRGL
ncbi:MAG: hypothetical protein SV422_12500 [Pseudomonadota bacterium]|nr:hypothetical protein [Pseudomonadota bacterium]